MPTLSYDRSPRRGLTLAEVLVSIGILAIGLLGVASLFPVGGFYMQSGDVADRAGALAQAALDDAIIRGTLDPSNWIVHDISANPTYFANLVSGLAQTNPGLQRRKGLDNTIARPVGSVMDISAFGSWTGVPFRNGMHGEAFAIDPLGLSANISDPDFPITNFARSKTIREFPSITLFGYDAPQWTYWAGGAGSWPVRRVTTLHTTAQLNSAWWLQQSVADALFTDSGDLAQTLPDKLDDPARMRFDEFTPDASGGVGELSAAGRQTRGDYSWLITVAPGSGEARDAFAISPDAYPCDVSVVVFHKRALGFGADGAVESERMVNAKVVTTSTGGGELLLERRDPSIDKNVSGDELETPFADFRAGSYVMLVGPHPSSTAERPQLFLQWYRVVSIDDSGTRNLAGGPQRLSREGDDAQVLVGLRGPDWPWRPNANLNVTSQLSNDLRVAIVPGIVAVHTKTMRLEAGSLWSVN